MDFPHYNVAGERRHRSVLLTILFTQTGWTCAALGWLSPPPSLGCQRLTGSLKLFEGLGIRFSGRFDDTEQTGTAIKGSSEVSVKRGSRLEKCPTDFSGFRDIDPLERLVPDVEKMPHQSEDFFAGQQVDRLSAADGAGTGASTSLPLRKPTPGDDLKNGLDFDGDGGSARAAEGALIDQILSGHKELFMDLIRPHQRTVYAMVFSLLANKGDAEDVAQDTLVKALARLHQFRRESTFGTWLIQMAINEARMRNRKQWRVPMMSLTRNKDKFFDECRVVRLPVRIEQIHSVWKTFLSGLPKDAANGRNPDATREKHRRPGEISMQRERCEASSRMIRSGNCRLHLPCGECLNTKSACCPVRNAKLAPFVSNQKAIVSLAILC